MVSNMEERNLFEGVSIERLEKALSLLYSNDEFEIKVKLTPKKEKEQAATCSKNKKTNHEQSFKNSLQL